MASVTDARNHVTAYVYDDLGRVMSVTSPDTGTTGFTFDAAGNILTRTDANNQTVSFVYDALNRPVQQIYPHAVRAILLTYDTVQAGKLSAIREEHSNRSFTYNALGQVTAETRTVGSVTSTVSYGYDATTGDLASMTYPSGRVLTYTRNTMGQVTGIQLDGSPLATDIHSLPFGPVRSATLGATDLVRTFDQRYQISRIQAGALDLQYTRDAAGRVTGVANLPSPAIGKTATATISPNSNRMLALEDGQSWSFTHDANGNVVSDGAFTYLITIESQPF